MFSQMLLKSYIVRTIQVQTAIISGTNFFHYNNNKPKYNKNVPTFRLVMCFLPAMTLYFPGFRAFKGYKMKKTHLKIVTFCSLQMQN